LPLPQSPSLSFSFFLSLSHTHKDNVIPGGQPSENYSLGWVIRTQVIPDSNIS
jgi:hypothetical protein